MTDESNKPPKPDGRKRLMELIGVDSTNFLNTGLTYGEFMKLYDAERLSASWCIQPREEKQRRLDAVVRLSVEYARICETTNFATAWAGWSIQAVIEGDWKRVEEYADMLTFDEERPSLAQEAGGIYATFRELLLQVLRTSKTGVV